MSVIRLDTSWVLPTQKFLNADIGASIVHVSNGEIGVSFKEKNKEKIAN